MSAASSATAQARRPAAPPAPTRPVARAAPGFSFAASEDPQDLIRINLGDVPRMEVTMDVEGFKPSILSRLLSLIVPLDKR